MNKSIYFTSREQFNIAHTPG